MKLVVDQIMTKDCHTLHWCYELDNTMFGNPPIDSEDLYIDEDEVPDRVFQFLIEKGRYDSLDDCEVCFYHFDFEYYFKDCFREAYEELNDLKFMDWDDEAPFDFEIIDSDFGLRTMRVIYKDEEE